MSKGTVLLVASNASEIEVVGGQMKPTGYYLNELVVPVMAVLNAGYDVVLATPSGGKPHLDKVSDIAGHFGGSEERLKAARDFIASNPIMQSPRTLRSVIDGGLDKYVALFVPGGQAPVVDLMQDPDLGEILRYFHANKKISAFLCHGPISTLSAMPKAKEFRAALVSGDTAKAKELAKGWQYAGYNMTIFANAEEKWVEDDILHAKMYFHMVDALQTAGAKVTTAPKIFEPNLVVDRELITGQNPASDHKMGEALVAALDRQTAGTKAA
jgi:putative intracellular protease/amidase